VRRRVVEVEVVLLDVLAVVAFVRREAEEALLEDGIALVPEREAEADALVAIRDAGQAILVPAVRALPRMVVREVLPGVAVRAVVLADGAPGALAQIGAPPLPMRAAIAIIVKTTLLGGHRRTD
jgi:hypothetical protein